MRQLLLALLACIALPPAVCAQADAVARLEIFPAARTLHGPTKTQQLAVIAHFKNGSKRDVTHLAQFQSSDNEIATVSAKGLVRFWQPGEIAVLCRYHTLASVQLRFVEPKPGFLWTKPPENNLVDHLIFEKLKDLSLLPSELCSDVVFLRRAYLDLCGHLPTPPETKRFLEDPRADKRTRLIDELLARPQHAELWAHHCADMLDLRSSRSTILGAKYLNWLAGQLRRGTPLDQLAREILTGKDALLDSGRGSFYYDAREPADVPSHVSMSFLGVRLQCAQCHPHFKAAWTPTDWHGFAAFFSQLQRRSVLQGNAFVPMVVFDPTREWLHPETKRSVAPRFLDGVVPPLKPGQDRRAVIAEWIASPKNPYFARTMVNHIWLHLLGKGLGDPPEALHEPWVVAHDALLDVLANELIAQRFDGQQIIRVIMNSRTYQLSATPNPFNKDDDKYFARGYARRLNDAVFSDVLAHFLEAPVEFDGMRPGTRAVQVLCSPQPFFGISRPQRLSVCEAEPREPNLAHMLHYLNSDEMQKRLKLPGNRVGRLLAGKRSDVEMLDDIFLAAFSRLPTDKDYKLAAEHLAKTRDRRVAWEDVIWAVINTREFAFRP